VIRKKLGKEETDSALKASKRLLAEFKKSGWDSEIDDDEKESMRNFQEGMALSK
jgi:hypothetical protein